MSISKKLYEKRLRVRVCGILEQDGRILLLKHENVGKYGFLWSPPGGGVEFGESSENALIREFKEETDLKVAIDKYMLTNEYIDNRYHAIELFFKVRLLSGVEKLGFDPEVPQNEQILSDLGFFSFEQLNQVSNGKKHNIFEHCRSLEELFELKGFYNFKNI